MPMTKIKIILKEEEHMRSNQECFPPDDWDLRPNHLLSHLYSLGHKDLSKLNLDRVSVECTDKAVELDFSRLLASTVKAAQRLSAGINTTVVTTTIPIAQVTTVIAPIATASTDSKESSKNKLHDYG